MEDVENLVVDNEEIHHWGIPGDHLTTKFQCDVCRFRNIQGSNPIFHRLEDNIFLCAIWWDSLDTSWIRRPSTVKNRLMMLKGMHEVADEVLGLVEGLPNLGLFPLIYEVEMG